MRNSAAESYGSGGMTAAMPMSRVGTIDEFKALWHDYGQQVWAAAYAMLPDAHIADDSVSEAYLRLWQQWHIGRVIAWPKAWLRNVARNLVADYAKSAFRRHGTQGIDGMNDLRSTEPSPPEAIMAAEILGLALDELPAADRDLILLKAEGYSNEELAQRFGRTLRSIKRWLEQVRASLRNRIKHLDAPPTRTHGPSPLPRKLARVPQKATSEGGRPELSIVVTNEADNGPR